MRKRNVGRPVADDLKKWMRTPQDHNGCRSVADMYVQLHCKPATDDDLHVKHNLIMCLFHLNKLFF